MMKKLTYKTLEKPLIVEIPKIKGSRFFATLIPVQNKEMIEAELVKIRKQYYDATHNCYARRLGVRAHQDLFGNWLLDPQYERANDDGEPTNTAGKPILSVIAGAELFDVLVVVTRYFGGTLLGVGGLIQSYTLATTAGIEVLSPVFKEVTKNLKIVSGYEQIAQVQYLISKYEAKVIEEYYEGRISQVLSVNLAYYASFLKELQEKGIEHSVL